MPRDGISPEQRNWLKSQITSKYWNGLSKQEKLVWYDSDPQAAVPRMSLVPAAGSQVPATSSSTPPSAAHSGPARIQSAVGEVEAENSGYRRAGVPAKPARSKKEAPQEAAEEPAQKRTRLLIFWYLLGT